MPKSKTILFSVTTPDGKWGRGLQVNWHRATTLVLLVNYLLTITFADCFHDHHHQVCGIVPCETGEADHSPAVCHHCCSHDDDGHCSQQVATHNGHRGTDCTADGCAVCHFLGQKFIPAHLTQVVTYWEFVETHVSVKPLPRSQSPLFSWNVRAPPVV